MSAHRAELLFCSRGSGLWCCSAAASERRRFWRCCTRWQRPARHGLCYGCTQLAIGSIIRLPPKSAASCPRSPTAATVFVTAGRTRATGWARISMPPATCRARLRRGRRPARGRCLYLRAQSLHGRHEGDARCLGRGAAAHWRTSAYQSILELAEACDVPVRWSCRTGVCHNCESGLVSGAVAYGPEPLDQPADGNLLICCSQPTSDVVIDL